MASSVLTGGATLLRAGSSIAQGNAANAAGKRQEKELNRQADRVLGVGSREAYEFGRRGKHIEGDATAGLVAGGGSTDAGSIDRLAQISAETNYNALAALYDANEEANQLRLQGREARSAGKRAKTAGYFGAVGSLLDGGSKILGKI